MNRNKKLLIILCFNFGLMLLEVFGGIFSGSLALLSDAGHMLTDTLAIFMSWMAFQWSSKPATEKRTFGYHRFEILAALVNGLLLVGVSAFIFIEAAKRFMHPQPIETGLMLVVAVIGLLGNLGGLLMLHSETGGNLNIRGAFMHILGDTISSVGVIAGGVIIAFTGWTIVDPLISVVIAGIVLRSAVNLILESGDILLESAPKDIDIDKLRAEVKKVPGVIDLHEIHVWTITSGRHAMSAHVLTNNISTRESQGILCAVRGILEEKFKISHSTLEVECDPCKNNVCNFQDPGASSQGPGHEHDHDHDHHNH